MHWRAAFVHKHKLPCSWDAVNLRYRPRGLQGAANLGKNVFMNGARQCELRWFLVLLSFVAVGHFGLEFLMQDALPLGTSATLASKLFLQVALPCGTFRARCQFGSSAYLTWQLIASAIRILRIFSCFPFVQNGNGEHEPVLGRG